MITNLQFNNFTAFTNLTIDFSPGINIIIGENGTGKTQLLKAILALSGPEARAEDADEQLARKLCRLYHPLGGQVGELRRAGARGGACLLDSAGIPLALQPARLARALPRGGAVAAAEPALHVAAFR